MKPKTALALVAVSILCLAPLPQGVATAAPTNVDITMNSMTVVGNAVTLNITNESTVAVKIEVNVAAYACADIFLPQVDCPRAAIGGTESTLAAGATADFTVTLTLGAGSYIFRGLAVGSKGGAVDEKYGFVGAVVP